MSAERTEVAAGRAARRRRSHRSQTLIFSVVGMLVVMAVAGLATTVGTGSSDIGDTVTLAATSDVQEDSAGFETLPEEQAGTELASDLTVTYEVYLSRDPFDPVVPEPEPTVTPVTEDGSGEGTVAPPGTIAPPVTVVGDGASPGDGTNGVSPPAEVIDRCSQDSPACAEQAVTVLEIGAPSDGIPNASLQIGTLVYDVAAGDTAGYYLVTAIEPRCVTLLYGDHGFRRCLGDESLK
jgi:hypothetical protein